ncbi:MAG: DUF983 domain-containing protein [Alphaproteobacteria bacterium]
MSEQFARHRINRPSDPTAHRSTAGALARGFRLRCPNCGRGRLFARYLKVAPACADCAEPFHHHRADDAPAYFTMLIVGHVVVAGVLWAEMTRVWPLWLHMAIWPPLVLGLSLALLPRIKGTIVALQWAFGMHGFGGLDND